jgi:hypothetical protein
MTTTFIYLCKTGDNEELRYSLRSVEKFFPDSQVWVVGGKPSWYSGNFIKVDGSSDIFQNVKNSLAAIITEDLIPEDVVVMNDDFFFVKALDKIPYYISGTLKDRISFNRKNGVSSSYIRRLVQSYKYCKSYKNPPLDFDIHVPMPVKKQLLLEVVKEPIMWRSNYGNRFVKNDETTVIADVKVYSDSQNSFKSYDYLSLEYPFVSTNDESFKIVYENLFKDMFPERSKYETNFDI